MARIALDEGLWDEDFVRERTEGWDAWRTSLAPYGADTVAAITGVDAPELRQAARLFARPQRGNSCLLWGMGITQHTRGVANVRALVNLALVTGQIGKPGSGLAPLRGQNNVQGCSDVGVLPDQLPGYQGLGDEARAKFGEAWSVELPAAPGLKLTEMIDAMWRGELQALYLIGENPLLTEPNLHHAREALSRWRFSSCKTSCRTRQPSWQMWSCPPLPSPRRMARSPTASGACSWCTRPSIHPVPRALTGRSRATWPNAWRQSSASRLTRSLTRIQARFLPRWRHSSPSSAA